MSRNTRELLDDALKLTHDERATLAAELIASLETDRPAEADRAWRDEVLRRARDMLEGRDPGIPAEDVFARLRAKRRPA
jgi:putative addiction module component (TIGR02574 family)